jgi:hypothetical protein
MKNERRIFPHVEGGGLSPMEKAVIADNAEIDPDWDSASLPSPEVEQESSGTGTGQRPILSKT